MRAPISRGEPKRAGSIRLVFSFGGGNVRMSGVADIRLSADRCNLVPMDNRTIVLGRMGSQGLGGRRFDDPAALVGWMGCVQAQDFAMAKWGVGLRMSAGSGTSGGSVGSEAMIDTAFNDGTILRTHVLRPTWHFVLPCDIGWMLALSAPRIRGFCQSYHRQLGIDAAVLRRSRKVVSKALQDGAFMTRTEIAALLRRAKIDTSDIRMNFLMMDAELEGLICSGPRRGKQFTYALLASRVVRPLEFSGDAALGELARRFFLSRGPATIYDFAWWGGMTVGDAKRGVEVVKGELERDGEMYWAGATSDGGVTAPRVLLLPAFDELTVAYKDRSAILPHEYEKASSYGLKPVVVVDGRIVGIWRREAVKGKVVVEVKFFEKVSKGVARLVEREGERYGRFLGEGVGYCDIT